MWYYKSAIAKEIISSSLCARILSKRGVVATPLQLPSLDLPAKAAFSISSRGRKATSSVYSFTVPPTSTIFGSWASVHTCDAYWYLATGEIVDYYRYFPGTRGVTLV